MAKAEAKMPKKETPKKQAAKVQTPEKQEESVFISEADQYLFAQGTHYDIYKKLGAHPSKEDGADGVFLACGRPMRPVFM